MDPINYLGYRFRPTEGEIISYFLERKIRGLGFPVHVINEVNICEFEPWELPAQSELSDEEEWYFFNKPTREYVNSARTKRTTNAGFWKVTGRDRRILANNGEEVIGFKKILVFHTGRIPNGRKTNWVIHEYHANIASPYQEPFVLCHLKGNLDENPEGSTYTRGESSRHAAAGQIP